MCAKISHSIFKNERNTSVFPFVQFAFCVDLYLLVALIPKIMASNNLYLKITFAKPGAEAERFAMWEVKLWEGESRGLKGKERRGVHSHLHTDHFECTSGNVHFFSQGLEEWQCFM